MPKMDSQSEERILFDSITSWEEKSHREISNIIKSYCARMNKGVNKLSEEVCDLKAQLSVITLERNYLLERVSYLSDKIKRPNVAVEQPLPVKEEGRIKEFQVVGRTVEVLYTEDQEVERPRFSAKTGDPEKLIYYEDPLMEVEDDESEQQSDGIPRLNTQNEQKYLKEMDYMPKDGDKRRINGAHEKIRNHVCGECGYAASRKSNLKKHIEAVHENIRKYVCKDCGYAASQSVTLKQHRAAIHKFSGKQLKCETSNSNEIFKSQINGEGLMNLVCKECGYSASRRSTLRQHLVSIHKMGHNDKELKCEHCPYTSANKSKFKNHVKAVHEKIKDYACDDCSYTTTLKEYLKKHRVNVHQKIM